MYFYLKRGKQHVDFRGDFILTHNDSLLKTRVKSAAPRYAHNATYILNVARLKRYQKIKATLAAIRFIWGEDTELKPRIIE